MTLPARKPEPSATDIRTCGPATYREVGGLHVLRLKGSQYEMGRQHGVLLKDWVHKGPVPYYRTYIEKILGTAGHATAAPLIASLIERLIGKRVARALPDFARDAIRGLADGADMPYDYLLKGCVMPDSLMWVAARSMRWQKISPAVNHRHALGLGCSSALAWGDATTDGKLLHARNLDYHGVDVWPKAAAVIFHEPDEGQKYVSVSAAGVLMGGVTAMNAAGLTLTVHQHMFTDATALGGTPIGLVGDIIMREAKNLDDAERILAEHTPIGCWTYLVTDGNQREVLCWEENPDRHIAMRTSADDTTFGYANIYLDPELGKTERNLYGSYWRHNLGRQQRLRERLAEGGGALDANGMASIVGDHGGSECRIHRAIAMLMTVGSVVFKPEDGVLWVATGETPVSNNPYEPFSLHTQDHAPELGQVTGGVPQDADVTAAYDAYRRAYIAFFEKRDISESRRLVARATELQPKQALYHTLSGLLALRDGDPNTAWNALGRALELGHPDPERLATFHLWRGRAADLLGQRAKAKDDYRAALGGPSDPPIQRAAERGLQRRYRRRQANKIDVDFTYIDVVAP
jgi:tetratricopeptide (TPR) repeat protein